MEIMLGVFCAMFAVAMVAVGLAAGFAIGWIVRGKPEHGKDQKKAAAVEIPEAEKLRLAQIQADQDAFHQMLRYTPEIAYGMGGSEMGGGGR